MRRNTGGIVGRVRFTYACVLPAGLLLSAMTTKIPARAANPSNEPVADGARLSCTVASSDGGKPIADARVFLLRRGMYVGKMTPRETRSAADGTFAFDGVAGSRIPRLGPGGGQPRLARSALRSGQREGLKKG